MRTLNSNPEHLARQTIVLRSEHDLEGWRKEARRLLQEMVPPERISWQVEGRAVIGELDLGPAMPHVKRRESASRPIRIAKECLKLLNRALLHRNEDRFDLAYRLLFRMQDMPGLFRNPADGDVKRLNGYAKAVRRDVHKMHAFVRFRKIGTGNGRERFAAWFEPDHHIVAAVAPFFRDRFTGMDWLIMTPDMSIAWDGKSLAFGPGGSKQDMPDGDDVETEWSTYYENIFNPARLKTQAMKSEMPVKYWHNLPEATVISSLIQRSGSTVRQMLDEERTAPLVALDNYQTKAARPASLGELNERMAKRTETVDQNFAVKAVFGEGPENARVLLLGEQPGDQEDLTGKPFSGPAGKLLRRAWKI